MLGIFNKNLHVSYNRDLCAGWGQTAAIIDRNSDNGGTLTVVVEYLPDQCGVGIIGPTCNGERRPNRCINGILTVVQSVVVGMD